MRGRVLVFAGLPGQACCYMQGAADITGPEPRDNFTCWEKPLVPGNAAFTVGTTTAPFLHFWEKGCVACTRTPPPGLPELLSLPHHVRMNAAPASPW